MKINFKIGLSILSITTMLFLQGCGGGSNTKSSNQDANISDIDKHQEHQIENKFKYNRISIAGSSVTWGNGFMGNGDYIGTVEKYYRESVAQTIIPDTLNSNGELIIDDMSYKRHLYKYNAGSEISGLITGKEISIVYAAQRGSSDVVVEMIVDGINLGEKRIKSNRVIPRSKSFTGDGSRKSFDLGEAHTFNHSVSGYGDGFMLTHGVETIDFGTSKWVIVRKKTGSNQGEVHHFITFKNPPNGNFVVNYEYGENIKPVKSSVDNVEKLIGSQLESQYGDLWKSNFEDLSPIYGLDFRQNNIEAIKTWSIGSEGNHDFTIKVKQGELILNFITNHMYFFQNAGIGGTSASTLKVQTGATGTIEKIREFNPDLFIFESSTNDTRTANDWIDRDVTFTNVASNKIKLDATPSRTIKEGDVVVMGEYNDDINNIIVGIVSSWDYGNNIITFTTDVSPATVKSCDIKRISTWENDVTNVIEQVTYNISHSIKVGIATCGVPNLNERRLMGYREKGMMMARENNWMFFDFFKKTLGRDWSSDNTHADRVLGQKLLGEAIIDVLKQ